MRERSLSTLSKRVFPTLERRKQLLDHPRQQRLVKTLAAHIPIIQQHPQPTINTIAFLQRRRLGLPPCVQLLLTIARHLPLQDRRHLSRHRRQRKPPRRLRVVYLQTRPIRRGLHRVDVPIGRQQHVETRFKRLDKTVERRPVRIALEVFLMNRTPPRDQRIGILRLTPAAGHEFARHAFQVRRRLVLVMGHAQMPQGQDDLPELRPPVAHVVLPDDVVTLEGQRPRQRVPDDRAAQVPDVHLLRDVRRGVIDHHGQAIGLTRRFDAQPIGDGNRSLTVAALIVAALIRRDGFEGGLEPVVFQAQVDEARPGDLRRFDPPQGLR